MIDPARTGEHPTRIGYAGLGAIGAPIASRILSRATAMSVFNRTRAKAVALVEHGATLVDSPRELSESSDIVVTCLFGPESVREVYVAPGGLLDCDVGGKIFLNLSTVGPACAREMDALAAASGAHYIDGALMGNPADVPAGTVVVLLAGDSATVAQAGETASAFSATVLPVGPVGAAQALKLSNNVHFGIRAVAIAEIAKYMKASGADPQIAFDLFCQRSEALGRALQKSMRTMLLGESHADGDVGTLAKDITLAVESADSLGCQLSTGVAAQRALHDVVAAGLSDRSVSALIEVVG